MLTQHDLPRKRRIEHVSKAEHTHRERAHTVQHLRERNGLRRRTRTRANKGRWPSMRGGEGGEGLRGDGQHRDTVSRQAWGGVRGEDGEDFGVGLKGDQDGFGGGDAAAARLGGFMCEGKPKKKRRQVERETELYLHARQSLRLISAVWSF